jgi:hypothetical protein
MSVTQSSLVVGPLLTFPRRAHRRLFISHFLPFRPQGSPLVQGLSSVQVLAPKSFHANAPPLALCDGPRPPPEPPAPARTIHHYGVLHLHLHHAHAVHTRSSQLLFLTRPSFGHASRIRHLSRRPPESRTFVTPCSAHLIKPSSLSESYQAPLLLAQLRRFDNTNFRPFRPPAS